MPKNEEELENIMCNDLNDECDLCMTNKCNGIYPAEKVKSCFTCNTNDDPNCKINATLTASEECPAIPSQMGCYHLANSTTGEIRRGCVSSLTTAELKNCKDHNSECKTCLGDNCNSKISFETCYTCDSRIDSDCVIIVENSTEVSVCKEYSAMCVTGVDKAGFVHRRCSANKTIDTENFPEGFELCVGNKCNEDIYPSYLRQCYQCNGEDECNFSAANKTDLEPTPCKVVKSLDQCFTLLDNDGKIYRGCTSDSSNARLRCDQKSFVCEKCTTNGCNNETRAELDSSNPNGAQLVSSSSLLLLSIGLLVILAAIFSNDNFLCS